MDDYALWLLPEPARVEGPIDLVGHDVPDTIISIDGRGVPFRSVSLEQITEPRFPPPNPPDLGDNGTSVVEALDERFELIPVERVCRWPDYWALRDVEADHCRKLASRYHLSAEQHEALRHYCWRGSIATSPRSSTPSPSPSA